MSRLTLVFFPFLLLSYWLGAQTASIRGHIYDQASGEAIAYGTILLQPGAIGGVSDADGFFTIANIPAGTYKIQINYIGYDSLQFSFSLKENQIFYRPFYLKAAPVELSAVNVSGERARARTEVQLSKISVKTDEIKAVPSIGGEADIAQYLSVLPGIVSSGDQGGQLYIRGGSPVQNNILLDGMTIYNPFHSLGLFSVFETEAIQQVDVYSAGFNAEYGGRISAVVDIQTREGNKKELSGLVSASPFQAKVLLEGPIIKLDEEKGNSISFLLTAKQALISETSKSLYPYAVDTTFYSFASGRENLENAGEEIGLPFEYRDLYGKLSFSGRNGSQLNLFGFNFTDEFNFQGFSALNWESLGGGANFTLIPPNSSVTVDGSATFSSYDVQLQEGDEAPRSSGINNFQAQINFTSYGRENQLNYGFGFNGFNTDFQFRNQFGVTFVQKDFTSELFGYLKYRRQINRLVLEPGLRLHYYGSQAQLSFEPRLGIKYGITENIRLKAGGGFYAQNLISAVREDDVVNFFVGFLAGPEQSLRLPGTGEIAPHRLQKAWHAVSGLEVDITQQINATVEVYYKDFTQLIQINRNKIQAEDPDFVIETGEAYGLETTFDYRLARARFWLAYSLAYVNRDDGVQTFPTIFDRRHNLNLTSTFIFGANKQWSAGLRWNLGSGFPFTQTQGFYQQINFDQGLLTDVLGGNFELGTILADERNGGRFPWYHRLDLNLQRIFQLANLAELELNLSVTNVYNRENIFYIDRITNGRVNQLPVIPSLGAAVKF